MKVLDDFFNNLKLPNQVVPNGSTIWENPDSTNVFDKVIHRRYYPLTVDKLICLENELNKMPHISVKFPDWYVNFLKTNNGCDLFFGAIALYGDQIINRSDPLHESPYSLYLENIGRHKKLSKHYLFIGSYGFDGTQIVIDTSQLNSKVFCIYSESDSKICEWNNFEVFFKSETKRLTNLYEIKPWGRRDKGARTLPDGHKDKK